MMKTRHSVAKAWEGSHPAGSMFPGIWRAEPVRADTTTQFDPPQLSTDERD